MPLLTIPSGNVFSSLPTGFNVDNSCRFNSGDSPQLSKSISSTSTTWTFSAWIKRAGFGNYYFLSWGASDWVGMGFGSTDYLQYYETTSGSNPVTTAKYRDPSAWYHIVVKNAAGTITFYVNGATPAGSGGTTGHALSSTTLYVGSLPGSNYTNAYMSEVCFIDGTAYSASDFGEYDEDSPTIWKPKDVSGLTFGSDGFYLDFKDSANLGNDANGGTDLTETNIAAIDQSSDSPTNNFCVMNPLANYFDPATFSEGNLSIVTETDGQSFKIATFGVSRGKWYWEIFRRGANGHTEIGIAGMPSDAANDYLGQDAFTYAVHSDDGNWFTGGSGTSFVSAHNSGGTYPNHVCMVALDLDNNKFYFGINGTWEDSGDPTSGATGTGAQSIAAASTTPTGVWFPAISDKHNSYNTTLDMNFGGGAAFGATAVASANQDADGFGNFEFSVPSGYFSICSKNLAEYG